MFDNSGVAISHKTLLWFVKGGQRSHKHQVDTLALSQRDKQHHRGSKAVTEAACYITKLTPLGGLVVDPYAGSGTTRLAALQIGRCYLAFERRASTARRARTRLAAAMTAGVEQKATKEKEGGSHCAENAAGVRNGFRFRVSTFLPEPAAHQVGERVDAKVETWATMLASASTPLQPGGHSPFAFELRLSVHKSVRVRDASKAD